MLQLIYFPEETEQLKALVKKSNAHKLLDQYLLSNKKEIQMFQEQNDVYIQYMESAQGAQIYSQEIKALELRKEELERQNQELVDQLKSSKGREESLQAEVKDQQELIKQLKINLLSLGEEVTKLNMAAESQAKDIREIHQSREQTLKDLQLCMVQKNQLEMQMVQEKIKLTDQLNELNEWAEQLQKQKRTLDEDKERLSKQFKDFSTNSPVQTLSKTLQASDAQISRIMLDDIPQMVQRRITKHHTVEINDLAMNINGSLIATVGGDKIVKLYDPINLNVISQNTLTDEIYTTCEFSPQFDSLLVSSTDNTSQIISIQQWKQKVRMVGHTDQITASVFLGGDKDSCITGSKDRNIKLWNIQSGSCIKSIAANSQVRAITSQNNVPVILSAHMDGSLRGYSIKSDQKPIFVEKNLFDDPITSISMTYDNNYAICCSKEGYYIKSYDLRMQKVLKVFQHDKYMNSYDHNKICFGPDERFIIAGCADGALISWNDQGKFHKHLTKGQHEGVVTCVQYHPVSGQMFSADNRGNLVIWK